MDGERRDPVSHSGSAADEQEQIDMEVGFPAAPKPATWRAMSFEEREDLIVRARVWVQVKLDALQDSQLLPEPHPAT